MVVLKARLVLVMLIFCSMLVWEPVASAWGHGGEPPGQITVPAPADPAFTGLDVLLLVDYSGSMGGIRFNGVSLYGPEGNDPAQVRFSGPQYMFDWLSDYRLVLGSSAPRINVAQIGFGNVVRPMLDWTAIAPDGTSDDVWRNALLDLQDAISVDRFGFNNLGYTDFRTAFAAARTLLQNAPPAPPGQNNRRAIIVFTDGAPCVPPTLDAVNFPCGDLVQVGAFDHLTALGDELRAWFSPDVYDIYVVGLDASGEFWPQLQSYWGDVACLGSTECDPLQQVTQVTDASTSGAQFNAILADLLAGLGNITSSLLNCPPCTFNVPPYTQFVRVSIFKNNASPILGVQLLSPAGPAGAAETGTDAAIQTYEITAGVDPIEPGLWTVSIPDPALVANISLASDLINARADASTSDTLRQYLPVDITARIVDSEGLPLRTYRDAAGATRYPLTLTVQAYDFAPDRADRDPVGSPVTLGVDPSAPDVNQFIGAVLFDQPGVYELRVTATFVDDAGTTVTLITDQTVADGLDVQPTRLDWTGLLPASVLQGQPSGVAARLLEPGGDLPVVDGDQFAFNAFVAAADGTMLVEPVVLPDTSAAAGEIAAALPAFDVPGSHTVGVQIGRVNAATGDFVAVGELRTFPLEVRPIQYVTLDITTPVEDTQEAQRWQVALPPVQQTSLPVRVEIRDEAGEPVSLAALTGGTEALPTLTIRQAGQPVTLNAALVEAQPGIYVADVTGFSVIDDIFGGVLGGRNQYDFAVQSNTPGDNLTGDYRWDASADTGTLARIPSLLTFVIPAVMLLLLVGLGVVTIVVRKRMGDQRTAPLSGSIELRIIDYANNQEDVIGSIALDTRVNTQTLTGLPAPFKRLTVTTKADEAAAKRGTAWVTDVQMEASVTLDKPDEIRLTPDSLPVSIAHNAAGVRYALVKIGAAGGGNDFFSGG